MKSIKELVKKVTLIGAGTFALMGALQSAQAQDVYGDISGSYIGRSNLTGAHFHLALRSLRAYDYDGGYVAILVQDKPLAIAVYTVDLNDDGVSYDLKPRQVTSDGELIGVENANPSLTMSVDGARDRHFIFSVTKANDDLNTAGFPGPIIFDSAFQSDLTWLDAAPAQGVYTEDNGSRGTKFFYPSTFVDNQTSMVLTAPNLNGKFILRESFPGIYTYRRVSATDEGNKLAQYPAKIVVFLKDPNIFSGFTVFGSEFAVMFDPIELITPSCDQHITKLIRRPWNN
jgi:hypothetical protein